MSIILDALRKSEHQCQPNATPGLAYHALKATNGKRTSWLIIVVILVLLNILLVVLWLNADAEKTVVARTPATQIRPAPTRENTRQASIPVPARPAGQQTTIAGQAAVQAPVSAPAEFSSDRIPSIESLQVQGIISLPPMRVDLHVYSEVPAERFVFINMKKQTEGSTLAEGPTVQEITTDGVVLSWQGQRFIMSKN